MLMMRRPHVVDEKNLSHHCGESNGKLEKIFSRSGVVFPERKQERNSRENLHLQDDAENRHFTAAKDSHRSDWQRDRYRAADGIVSAGKSPPAFRRFAPYSCTAPRMLIEGRANDFTTVAL
ncbi:MAG: hypothetical protein IID45_10460 [Planctomycetes bacterium]|nr:hypothetical protein [Planctomycetota bacterium]